MNTSLYKTKQRVIGNYGSPQEKEFKVNPNMLALFDHRKPPKTKRFWLLDITTQSSPKLLAYAHVGNGSHGAQAKDQIGRKSGTFGSENFRGNCCNRSSLGLSVSYMVKTGTAKCSAKNKTNGKYGSCDIYPENRTGAFPNKLIVGLEPWNGMQQHRQVMWHQTCSYCTKDKYVGPILERINAYAKKHPSRAAGSWGCWTVDPAVHHAIMQLPNKSFYRCWHYAYAGGPSIQSPKDVDNDCHYSPGHWGGRPIKSKILGHQLPGNSGCKNNPRSSGGCGGSVADRMKMCLPYPVY